MTGTNLSDYTSSIVCKLGTTTVASGDGTSLGDIPVGEAYQVVCTITNTRITGSLKITKVLYVGGSNFNTATKFSISYSCKIGTLVTKSGTVQLAGGESTTIIDIPTGSICTVTEPTQPAPPTGYSWWVSITGSPTAAISATVTPEVTVTNSLKRTALTPGYWKNHLDVAFSLTGGSAVKLGNYAVSTKPLATKVFNAMNCSSSKPNDAIGASLATCSPRSTTC